MTLLFLSSTNEVWIDSNFFSGTHLIITSVPIGNVHFSASILTFFVVVIASSVKVVLLQRILTMAIYTMCYKVYYKKNKGSLFSEKEI